jgi:hypothetical protein
LANSGFKNIFKNEEYKSLILSQNIMSVTGIEDLHHSETRMEWAFQSFEAKVSSKVSSDRSIGISKKGGMPQ